MKRLKFELQERTNTYKITNKKKEYIGYLEYYKDWKCWILNPMYDCIFSDDCMQEIVNFMKGLKER